MRKSLEFNSHNDIFLALRIMRRHQSFIPGVLALFLRIHRFSQVIVVNTTNNVSPERAKPT